MTNDEMKDYEFGLCRKCNSFKPLKNRYCPECQQEKIEIPDFLKDIFKGF